MPPFSAANIEVPFNDDSVKIVGVTWTEELGLTVSILSKRSRHTCEVHFERASGFRMLHELDLASWWSAMPLEARKAGWLYEVSAGGWLAFESSRPDFYSQYEEHDSEYLITGYQECLSVLSNSPPVIAAKEERDA
jgi:hypothetical protein